MKLTTRKIVYAGLVAAIYSALTLSAGMLSFMPNQLRISEALTVLPFFSSFSVFGLFIGCLISNLLGPYGLLDIIVGSLATLIAAIITYYIGKSNIKFKKIIAPLPAVIVNAVLVGVELAYTTNSPFVPTAISVGIGELLSCYILGLPLLLIIDSNKRLKQYFK